MADASAPEKPPEPKPAKGNVFSNVHVRRVADAYVAIEHPKGWTEEQVRRALGVRMIDFGGRVQFWNAENRSALAHVYVGEFDPDERMATPFVLTVEDLAAMETT